MSSYPNSRGRFNPLDWIKPDIRSVHQRNAFQRTSLICDQILEFLDRRISCARAAFQDPAAASFGSPKWGILRLIWQNIALGQSGGMRVNPMLETTGALEKLGLPVVRRTADVNVRFRAGELSNLVQAYKSAPSLRPESHAMPFTSKHSH